MSPVTNNQSIAPCPQTPVVSDTDTRQLDEIRWPPHKARLSLLGPAPTMEFICLPSLRSALARIYPRRPLGCSRAHTRATALNLDNRVSPRGFPPIRGSEKPGSRLWSGPLRRVIPFSVNPPANIVNFGWPLSKTSDDVVGRRRMGLGEDPLFVTTLAGTQKRRCITPTTSHHH